MMAQGVPMNYGTCDGGPWNGKHLAHHEPVFVVPIERATRRVVVAVQPGTKGYLFGQYAYQGMAWHWSPPDSA